MESVPPLHAKRRLAWAGAGVLAFLLSLLLSRFPALAEATYGQRIAPAVAWGLSRVTGVVPLSVAELLIAAFFARQIVAATRGIVVTSRGDQPWRRVAAAGALRLGQDLGVVVVLLYVLWGFQYARPRAEVRLAWPAAGDVGVEVVAGLAAEMVDAANDAYRELHGVDDAGEPTALGDLAALDASIEEGWRRAAAAWHLQGPVAARFGPTKRLLSSPILDRLGLSGFFFPFTGEANVNAGVPAVSYPQVVAHEKSHQRGVGPEREANFFGFLAGSLAPDPHARYAAYVFAQRQLLFALSIPDRERVEELVARRLPGVQRDVDDLRAYWERHLGPARDVTRALNDAYLKTNRVEGGVHSYGRSVELLLALAAQQEGRLTPTRRETEGDPGSREPDS
jgi:hypothetical protein